MSAFVKSSKRDNRYVKLISLVLLTILAILSEALNSVVTNFSNPL